MYVSKEMLLDQLPPFEDAWVTITPDQDVGDIINAMVESYPEFVPYYDRIGHYFEGRDIADTCDNLYQFCIDNIQYREETEKWQTISLPSGILTRGHGDCKAYAAFIGGCLGAIARKTGVPIDWEYCFASYKLLQTTPYHVFVVVHTPDGDIWVDPTPGADGKVPIWVIYKRPDWAAAGFQVNGSGQLEAKRVGSSGGATQNIAAGALQLPQGYPAGIPQPYMVNGKIQFTPVPPNFTPTDQETAYMMLALQMWVVTYSAHPYNVFAWRAHTDGTGAGIASWVVAFCENFGSLEMQQVDKPINPFSASHYASGSTGNTLDQIQAARKAYLRQIRDFDFGDPPAPFTPSEIDKIMDGIAATVLKTVSNLIPVIGPAYANMWLQQFNQGATAAANLNAGTAQQANNILAQQQAMADEQAAGKMDTTTIIVIGAAALLLWWWYTSDN